MLKSKAKITVVAVAALLLLSAGVAVGHAIWVYYFALPEMIQLWNEPEGSPAHLRQVTALEDVHRAELYSRLAGHSQVLVLRKARGAVVATFVPEQSGKGYRWTSIQGEALERAARGRKPDRIFEVHADGRLSRLG